MSGFFFSFRHFLRHVMNCIQNWRGTLRHEDVSILNQSTCNDRENSSHIIEPNRMQVDDLLNPQLPDDVTEMQDDFTIDDGINWEKVARNFGTFMLKLKAEHIVTNAKLDFIVNNLETVLEDVIPDE